MIIGLAGLKQSGKSTTCNILHGIVLKERGMISDYSIGDEGQLLIKTPDINEWSVFDVNRKDEEFVAFAEKRCGLMSRAIALQTPLRQLLQSCLIFPIRMYTELIKIKIKKLNTCCGTIC